MSVRTDKGWRWFKWVVMIVAMSAIFKVVFWAGNPSFVMKVTEAVAMFVGGTVVWGGLAFLLGWATGKNESTAFGVPVAAKSQVKQPVLTVIKSETSPAEAQSNLAPILATPNTRSPHSQSIQLTDDDAIYEAISNELKTGASNEGLWTRLFAECDGDENKTKAAYIRARAAMLLETPALSHSEKPDSGSVRGTYVDFDNRLRRLGCELRQAGSDRWTVKEPLGGRTRPMDAEELSSYICGREHAVERAEQTNSKTTNSSGAIRSEAERTRIKSQIDQFKKCYANDLVDTGALTKSCNELLNCFGYTVTQTSVSSWRIIEPLGGKPKIRSASSLKEYVISAATSKLYSS